MRTQFLAFRARARQLTTPHTRIYFLTSGASSRLSVVVPIKASKKAAVRNHFKRLVYEATWKLLKEKNLDCVVMFKPLALPKGKPTDTLLLSEINSLQFN